MKVNLHNAEFFTSAANKAGFIRDDLIKIAFAGRSNVGKSSTINAILNRKKLARVSESPGKTIHVNYFKLDSKIYFIDLPGYGFARVSRSEKERWGKMMEDFFDEGGLLSLCVLLVDLRHKPTADDIIMCDYFKASGYPFIVAANKADDVKKSQVEGNIALIRETLKINDDVPVVPYSARKKEGISALLAKISKVWETDEQET